MTSAATLFDLLSHRKVGPLRLLFDIADADGYLIGLFGGFL